MSSEAQAVDRAVAPAGDRRAAAWAWLVERTHAISFVEALFFVYVAGALLLLTFFVPPFQKADEPAHYYRAVSITNLELACRKGSDGEYSYAMKRKYADLPGVLHTDEVAYQTKVRFNRDWLKASFDSPVYNETAHVPNYCALPAVGYLPTALGVLAGKPLQNPLTSFYLGRLFGAVFFVLALVLSSRVVPARYRPIVYLYAALPTVLHQVSAVSYDVVQLSLFPVIFAYLTKFLTEDRPIKGRELVVFMVAIWWAINIKIIPYAPLVLLFFALRPANVATSRRWYAVYATDFLGITAISTALFAWLYLPRVSYVSLISGHVNGPDQIRFVLSHPDKFIAACYQTLNVQGEWQLKQTIGVFGWTDTPYNYFPYYVIAAFAGALLLWTAQRDVASLKLRQVVIILLSVLAMVGVLFASLYAVWSPVGARIVDGLQGRYFVGLLPFAFYSVSQLAALAGKRRFLSALAIPAVAILLWDTYRAIDLRFYG